MTTAYQLRDIHVSLGGREILNIPSLDLMLNQSTALLGENGAGKTTLMNLLAFLQAPDSGQITLFQHPVRKKLTVTQRRQIGYVTQQPYMLNGSIRDNLKLALRLQQLPSEQHAALIDQALTLTNLSTLADQDAATLSGGELKRAAIARAMVYEPDILLLDEPFSHLDQRHIRQLESMIDAFAASEGKTVIFSTHDRLQAMAIADHSINLVGGKISSSPLLNLYHGQFRQHVFDTGKLQIHTGSLATGAHHIAIDPHQIIVSDQPLHHTSMLNRFAGRLIQITEEADQIVLRIDCGERFYAIITPTSLQKLSLQLGDTVWVNFKAHAVSVF